MCTLYAVLSTKEWDVRGELLLLFLSLIVLRLPVSLLYRHTGFLIQEGMKNVRLSRYRFPSQQVQVRYMPKQKQKLNRSVVPGFAHLDEPAGNQADK